MIIDSLIYRTGADLRGLDRDLDRMGDMVGRTFDRIGSDLRSLRMPKFEMAPPRLEYAGDQMPKAEDSIKDAASQIPAALQPVAAQIQSAFRGAFADVAPILSRTSAQFEAMAGSVLATNRRLDSEVKFDNLQKNLARARDKIQAKFADLDEVPLKWARRADAALGAVQFFTKLGGQIDGLRSFNSKVAGELSRIKSPRIDFGAGAASVRLVGSAADKAAGSFRGLGLQVAGALGLFGLGYKAVGFLKEGIKDASDLNESLNKTRVLMGDSAGAVIDFADESARSFGSSKAATLDMATEFAALGEGLGELKGKELEDFAVRMTKLARDVGSIKNTSAVEIARAMRSNLSGEQSDIMKGLAVITTEATVKEYALAHGIAKVGEELSEAQKFMARAGIETEKLAFANGDLANTINDPANAYRRFQGQLDNFGAAVGAVFLPAAAEILGAFDKIATAGDDAFGRNQSVAQSWSEAMRFAAESAGLYLVNWSRTVELATISAEQTVANFAIRLQDQFDAIGGWFTNAFEHPIDLIVNELGRLENNFVNVFRNMREIATKGLNANLVGIDDGWKGGRKGALVAPKPPTPLVDRSAEMARITAEIEANRPMPPRPGAAGAGRPKPPNEAANAANFRKLEKAQDELESFAKGMTRKVRNPLEEYGEYLLNAKKAFKRGLITEDQYKRADKQARKESGLEAEPKFAAAAVQGSQESYAATVKAVYGMQKDDAAERQLKFTQEELATLREILRELGKLNGKPPQVIREFEA